MSYISIPHESPVLKYIVFFKVNVFSPCPESVSVLCTSKDSIMYPSNGICKAKMIISYHIQSQAVQTKEDLM